MPGMGPARRAEWRGGLVVGPLDLPWQSAGLGDPRQGDARTAQMSFPVSNRDMPTPLRKSTLIRQPLRRRNQKTLPL